MTAPAFLTLGFRPFFLAAGLWAALCMALWIGWLSGLVELPWVSDPVAWHGHELLFGFLGAAIAGFLLTAGPSWTGQGRLPPAGLAALAGLWLAGRAAMLAGEALPAALVAALDLSMPVALAAVFGRWLLASGNARNLTVLAALVLLIAGGALFHWELATEGAAASGPGMRLTLAAGVILVVVIGGRVTPSFTRNWLRKRGATRLPPEPARIDALSNGLTAAAALVWVAAPEGAATAALLLAAAALLVLRLALWRGAATGAEPLLLILHVAFAFAPLGAAALALSALGLWPGSAADAQHLWMAGSVGVMALAMMTRASQGHSGGALSAGPGTTALYVCIVAAALLRPLSGALPDLAAPLQHAAAALWICGFGGFAALYGPGHLRPAPG